MNEKRQTVFQFPKTVLKVRLPFGMTLSKWFAAKNKEDVKVTVKLINPDIKNIKKSGDDYCLAVTSDQLKRNGVLRHIGLL
ncbi:MAG: hypothetical protein L6V93_00650 [Clostridiales bacterium]|nr:MAG: hypothetical protein L6V93_00650 [Clostridiales bacterium]